MNRFFIILFLVIFASLFSTVISQDWNTLTIPTGWEVAGNEGGSHSSAGSDKVTSDFLGSGSAFGYLRLTENAGYQRGWAYYKNLTFGILSEWSIDLEVHIGGPADGADGLAIVFLDKDYVETDRVTEDVFVFDPLQVVGGYGEWQGAPHQANTNHLGYHGDDNFRGYSFEWDHYKNNAEFEEYNHWVDIEPWVHSGFGQDMGGTGEAGEPGYYYNNGWRHCRLSSNGSGTFTFQYSSSDDLDLDKQFTFMPQDPYDEANAGYNPVPSNFDAYVGFTAATGGAHAYHDIRNVEIRTGDDALPVTLSSFTANYLEGNAQLQWVTQSESNNLGWNVYRNISDNAEDAVQVNYSLIAGAGSTSDVTQYNYYDESVNLLIDQHSLQNGDNVWYWLESQSIMGSTTLHDPVVMTINNPGEEDPTPDIPDNLGLMSNYPNPFNPNTYISFNLKEGCEVELSIFNTRGQKVKTLFSGFAEGDTEYPHTFLWDGRNLDGQKVQSGVYLYRLKSKKESETRKMILMQ